MRASLWAAVAIGASGCGNILGIDDVTAAYDGGGGGDAVVGNTPIKFHGNLQGTDGFQMGALGGATISFYLENGSFVKTADANASGDYELDVMVDVPVDGYFKIEQTGFPDLYDHLLIPVDHDVEVDALDWTHDGIDSFAQLDSESQPAGTGWVVFNVVDSDGAAVGNAGISATTTGGAAHICVTNPKGGPNCETNVTFSDGIGYIFAVPTGSVTGMATSSGNVAQYSFDVIAGTSVFAPLRLP
ncbi:MAG TPA: hypothetical protein VGM88_06285 [Kofleriaceae bacterium]|jgi:hypothetical protein